MKKYTQADFDSFEVDEWGYKICPTGDYTAIKSFGEWCEEKHISQFTVYWWLRDKGQEYAEYRISQLA